MDRTIEQRTMRKVYWRLLPFTGLLYLICYIDRVNVGFAALTMRGDLGLSQAAFGLGAGTAFFHRLFHPRSAEQRDPRQGRGAAVDRPDHDHLGPRLGRDGVRRRAVELLSRALPARPRRGGLLSRHGAVLHLLVPDRASRPHHRRVHDRDPDLDRDRRTGLDDAARTERRPRPRRLEVDVSLSRRCRRCCSASSCCSS